MRWIRDTYNQKNTRFFTQSSNSAEYLALTNGTRIDSQGRCPTMPTPSVPSGHCLKTAAIFLLLPTALKGGTATWNNSSGDGRWSTPANWSTNSEPGTSDIASFPAGLGSTVILTSGESASSLQFADNYLLSGGGLSHGGNISVSGAAVSTIDSPMALSGPLVKTGTGTLVLGGTNTNTFGSSIESGALRVKKSAALGSASGVTTVHGGARLEISTGGSYMERQIKLMDGSSIISSGNGTNISMIALDPGATEIHLGAPLPSEILALGLGDDDNIIGGTPSTVVDVDMTGTVRLSGKSTLPAGSSFVGTGGGNLEISFANAGSGAPIVPLVSPVGQAGIKLHHGILKLLMRDLTVNPSTFNYSFSAPLSFSGNVTLHADKAEFQARGSKTIQVPSITLAADSILKVGATSNYKIESRDPLILQGSASISGSETTANGSTLLLPAGIQGTPTTALTISAPNLKPLTLDIGAASTHGGGTTMLSGAVDLRAANALGPGPLSMSGGSIRVHVPGAFNGTLNSTGGTLQAERLDALNSNPVSVNGGTIVFRSNVDGTAQIPSLSFNSSGYIGFRNAGQGSPQISLPEVHTIGTTSLSVESSSAYGTVGSFVSTGDLQLSVVGNSGLRNNSISFDLASRKLVKAGSGPLFLNGSSNHQGGTEILNGNLLMNNHAAIGDGPLSLGGEASYASATLTVASGVTYPLPETVTFNAAVSPQQASIIGNLALGSAAHDLIVGDSSNATIDLLVNSDLSGSALSLLRKRGPGTLALYGNAAGWGGSTIVEQGVLELNRAGNPALGTGNLSITGQGAGTTRVRTLQSNQIPDITEVWLNSANEVFLELNNNTEAIGALTLAQSDAFDFSAVKTGSTGKLILNGKLTLQNNTDSTFTNARNVLITGNGGEATPDSTGFLDLGGGQRIIEVTTTTTGANATKANATIETAVINGGLVKTGARTLFLTNPNNTFAGGLQVTGGNLSPAFPGSLGSGPIRIAPSGASAGLELAKLGSSNAQNYSIAGNGEALLLYAAPSPQKLSLTGNVLLEGNSLTVEVTEGTRDPASSAILEINGKISETSGATAGLIKRGNGVLKLATDNTFTGESFIRKGTLSIASASALGSESATLHFDGGNLLTSASFSMARGLRFTFAGGTISPAASTILDLTGPVTWSGSTSSVAGQGMTIVSGPTSGTGALWLGRQLNFAPENGTAPQGQVLSIRGSSSLPLGNLLISQAAILELGNGDFTRSLGTGANQVQLPTKAGAGWAAFGADRAVNLGGAGQTLGWGQGAHFLSENVAETGWVTGPLILGSSTGTHTVDFQNGLLLGVGPAGSIYRLLVKNGPAETDAKISGDLLGADVPVSPALIIDNEGKLEINGDLSRIGLVKTNSGDAFLKGDIQDFTSIEVQQGGLFLYPATHPSEDASFSISEGAILNASALQGTPSPQPFSSGVLAGTYTGNLTGIHDLSAGGTITGDASIASGGSLSLMEGKTFAVGGDLNLPPSGTCNLIVKGSGAAQLSRMRVEGAVHLAGSLNLGIPAGLALGNSFAFLLNGGDEPIQGNFANLPEGGVIPINGGMALKITYQANGDGGAVPNDVGFTVVEEILPDLSLAGTLKQEVVAPGESVTLTYRLSNLGTSTIAGGELQVTLPTGSAYVSSSPAASPEGYVLTFPMTSLAAGEQREVSINLTAPISGGPATINAAWSSTAPDSYPANDSSRNTLIVIPGGILAMSHFERAPSDGTTTLAINTFIGLKYRLQFSENLFQWDTLEEFDGNGEVITKQVTTTEEKGFFRFMTEAAE